MSAKMRVDLFGREYKQVVPDALLIAPLFYRVPLMEIRSIKCKIRATNTTTNKDHIPVKDYLPTTFGATRAKRSGGVSCIRCRGPTYRPTEKNDDNIQKVPSSKGA